jgi:hypothetical protein
MNTQAGHINSTCSCALIWDSCWDVSSVIVPFFTLALQKTYILNQQACSFITDVHHFDNVSKPAITDMYVSNYALTFKYFECPNMLIVRLSGALQQQGKSPVALTLWRLED